MKCSPGMDILCASGHELLGESMSHLISCPECKKHLQVPDDLIGKKVQCPECKHTFTAEVEVEQVSVSSKPSQAPPPVTNKPPAWDTKKGNDDDEEEDGYNVRKRRRNRDRDDEDDDDDDRRSGRRRRRSRHDRDFVPHRGGMILAFGIIALVSGLGIIFGPIAWIMGNSDLAEIQNGTMDPEGEGMTQTGRILGMIATILSLVAVVVTAISFMFVFGCACCVPIMAAAGNPPRPRR
jgi:predicted Zn finger-like uncharacterized protein